MPCPRKKVATKDNASSAATFARARSVVAVQDVVEAAPDRVVRAGLDGAGDRVAAEEDVRGAAELTGLDDLPVGHGDPGARGDVETGLDDALVAERDADARLGADQAALADGDPDIAAAGEGA